MSLVIETNLGDLRVNLLVDQAPKSCLNFLKLSKIRYYEYVLFHRIDKDFIAQSGDPTGTGKGGESIFGVLGGARFFEDELSDQRLISKGKHVGFKKKGVLGMANSGKNKNASQFFITLVDGIDYLDDKYSAFGCASEDSFEVLDQINKVFCEEKGKPLQKVWIKGVRVENDPFPDPNGLIVPDSVEPTVGFKEFAGIDADEQIELESGLPEEEVDRRKKQEEVRSQALTLEMLGDLPSAEVKPPENVLFVCRLNPLTEDDDLRMIFSRFGNIISCQVIRDHKTAYSLGYAFIEFEEKTACEVAYRKMENVLIDDKRIHVDFSQSVSKLHRMWEQARRKSQRMTFDRRDIEDAYEHRSRSPDHHSQSQIRYDRYRDADRDRSSHDRYRDDKYRR